jgi:hypothetical protein
METSLSANNDMGDSCVHFTLAKVARQEYFKIGFIFPEEVARSCGFSTSATGDMRARRAARKSQAVVRLQRLARIRKRRRNDP